MKDCEYEYDIGEANGTYVQDLRLQNILLTDPRPQTKNIGPLVTHSLDFKLCGVKKVVFLYREKLKLS